MPREPLEKQEEKPFWLQPPWMILFDLIKLHKIKPWDINLTHLLTTMLSEMRRRGYIDFTASGVALLSSATIYRMKTELILKMETPPPPSMLPKPPEYMPPPIQLPFRYEYTSTTIKHLLNSLEEALRAEPEILARLKLQPLAAPPPPSIPELDQFMTEIEDQIEKLYKKVFTIARGEKPIPFTAITTGLKRLDSIRAFIIILFLASRGKIKLWQEKEFGEIYISLTEGESAIDRRAAHPGIV